MRGEQVSVGVGQLRPVEGVVSLEGGSLLQREHLSCVCVRACVHVCKGRGWEGGREGER